MPFYLLDRNFSLFRNSFLPLRLSISPEASPSVPIYLLPLRHRPFVWPHQTWSPFYLLPSRSRDSISATFAIVNTSDHHCNIFVPQHLSIFFLPVVVVASHNTFVWPHLRFTSTPLPMIASCVTFVGVNTSSHGRVWRQHPPSWCIHHHIRWHLVFPFSPFTVLLEYGFESLFFFKFDDFWDLS